METFKAQQEKLLHKIANSYANFKKEVQTKMTRGACEVRMEALDGWWATLNRDHNLMIRSKNVDFSDDYFERDFIDRVKEVYVNKKEEFREHLNRLLREEASTTREETTNAITGTSNCTAQPNLPRLDLPTFSGVFLDWLPFKDLFESLVVRERNIPEIAKMQYLRSCVTGEAANYISSIPIAGGNFNLAWETLLIAYENKRRLVNSHIDRLFSVCPARNENSAELRRVLTSTLNSVRPLSNLQQVSEQREDLLVYLTVKNLHPQTRKEWENYLGNLQTPREPPTLDTLVKFLESAIISSEAFESGTHEKGNTTKLCLINAKAKNKSNVKASRVFHVNCAANRADDKCALCNRSHFIMFCSQFRAKTPQQRQEIVKSNRICINCLSYHLLKDCNSTKRCRYCKGKHHSMLHDSEESASQSTPMTNPCTADNCLSRNEETDKSTLMHLIPVSKTSVLLATILVQVIGPQGNKVLARGLVDQCAQSSFISESLCQRLRLTGKSTNVEVMGLVERNITFSNWNHVQGLTLADPEYSKERRIDLLLSAAIHARIVEGQVKKGDSGEPIATLTALGWMLSGDVNIQQKDASISSTVLHCIESERLTELLRKFWEQEDFQASKKILTPGEQECENFFVSNFSRHISGRYIVCLPLKDGENAETIQIGSSYSAAARMLNQMERRFLKDDILQEKYKTFMKEYIKMEHMKVVSRERDMNSFYLPHHGVWKDSSKTTKLRVVFNGSQRTDKGVSLNDKLHIGPNLLPDLADVVLRWRRYRFAFTADIEKMFRQVLVDERDQHLQKIVWRFNVTDPVLTYTLRTGTYGLVCSPYLANRCVTQLAQDEGAQYPVAAPVLLDEIYMDDVLTGAHTLKDARHKQEQLINLMVGGFPLRKWAANDSELLEWLPPEVVAVPPGNLAFPESRNTTVLGLSWDPQDDVLYFRISIVPCLESSITKRQVLSNISKLFDPLGWLAPIIITAKIFIQSLWLLKTDGDSDLPDATSKIWKDWYYSLPVISNLKILRWINFSQNANFFEIHAFSDASQRALVAVVYLRVVTNEGCTSSLILSKSKVAPIKTISIPRLELCAAVLAARLAKHCQYILKLMGSEVHLWSDSIDVLYWLKDHPSRWQTFVANRCSEILNLLPNGMWHHIRSADNPADAVSRGLTPSELMKSEIWWHGPEKLTRSNAPWPASKPMNLIIEPLETRKVAHVTTVMSPVIWDLLDKYSSLPKLIRISAFCFRFLRLKLANKITNSTILKFLKEFPVSFTNYVTADEIEFTHLIWVHLAQSAYFSKEISLILANKPLPGKSNLQKLCPFLDGFCLRVGGRLKHSLLSEDEKHPLILPPNSRLTTLIIEHVHHITLHGGIQLTLSSIRRKYWILGGRKAVKKVIHNCLTCRRYSASTMYQKMGNLPETRVRVNRPFLNAGVDYAGPFSIRVSPGCGSKSYKGYVALFICLSTKAVHLEVVSSYDSASFLAAFKRFVSRRGHCASLLSDQGKNFIGADADLRNLFRKASVYSNNIIENLSRDGTSWRFNPPTAPHFGGIWEAAVKSTRYHLKRVIGQNTLTYEEFSTLLCQIKACLNSRPLVPLTDNIADLQPLTPAHFLIGSASMLITEPRITAENLSPLKRWLLITQMSQHFWDRWSAEYLQNMQRRSKWAKESSQLEVDDVVLVKSEVTSPTKWPLPVISELHPGSDGLARVATIRTSTSTFRRPTVKLVLLHRPK